MRATIDACARGFARGLDAVAEREAVMLRVVHEEREAALQALAEREAETSAGREALAVDRVVLDSEIGVMEAAARQQESRVLLNVGGGGIRDLAHDADCSAGADAEGDVLGAAHHRRR